MTRSTAQREDQPSMSLDKGTKEEITKKFQLHEKDTGSADVQIAILTERIEELTEHLKKSPKDHSSRLALLKLVGQRRKLLNYLNSTDTKRYQTLCKRLDLRK
jgi:small subunit ribosomal protein S15